MHEKVLRDGPDNLSLRLSCITRPLWLRTVTHRHVGPTGLYIHCAPLSVGYSPTSSFIGFGRARVFYFWSILYYHYYSVYIFISKFNWVIRWTWLSVFNVSGHIRVWSLLYFIILFSRLIWDLDISEELFPLAPDWYRESREFSFGPWLVQRGSHLLLYLFYHFTGR
jgi:hypothetical protein